MADVKANVAAVTAPPVTKSTAPSGDLFCKQDHRVRVLQPNRQRLMILQKEQEGGGKAYVGELRMVRADWGEP